MAAGELLLLALLFLKGKGKSGTPKSHIASPAELLQRATQPRAMAWVPYFVDVGESPAVADALARWAGIESGGDPRSVSVLNERGLLQVGAQTQSEGGISAADWAELVNPDTLPNTDARIASHYWRWLLSRAIKHLPVAPLDGVDSVWFAYAYHQRPKDFTEWGTLPPNAASAAAYLLQHTGGNPQLAKRVAANNVVAFGTPTAPIMAS